MSKDIYTVEDGVLKVNLHEGQYKALKSTKRIVLVLAGSQAGKSSFGPIWLYNEIQKCGPGEYLVVGPSFSLLDKKAVPEFRRLFETTLELGKYRQQPTMKFEFSPAGLKKTFGSTNQPCTVNFGHAANPDSLESATYKAVWADECGQSGFKVESYEAIMRRLAIYAGRILMTTTPYVWNWLKKRIWDKWKQDPDGEIDVIEFESTMNPAFSKEMMENFRASMPKWKFEMMHLAKWTRPSGNIFDCFDERIHCIDPFDVSKLEHSGGADFGNQHTAFVGVAIDREGKGPKPLIGGLPNYYVYRTYLAGGKSVQEHADSWLSREDEIPYMVGGAPSEDGWRDEYAAAGMPISRPSIKEVELGLALLYEAFKSGRLYIFNTLTRFILEVTSYSRKTDEDGQPTDEIENKHTFHRVDSCRYCVAEHVYSDRPLGNLGVVNTMRPKDEQYVPRIKMR